MVLFMFDCPDIPVYVPDCGFFVAPAHTSVDFLASDFLAKLSYFGIGVMWVISDIVIIETVCCFYPVVNQGDNSLV